MTKNSYMKRVINKALSLVSVCFILLSASCSNKGDVALEAPEAPEEIITVSLSLGGELRETQTPMASTTRAESNDLYGIQVLAIDKGPMVDGELTDSFYAWGIFDDLSDVSIDLGVSTKYSIEIAYIPKGKHYIYNYGDDTNVCYEMPLNTSQWSETTLNKFNYSSREYLYALDNPEVFVDIVDGEYIPATRDGIGSHNAIDFYYGKLTEYVPKENGVIIVDMKRHVCGIEFIAMPIEGYSYDKIVVKFDDIGGRKPRSYYINKNVNGSYDKLEFPLVMMCTLGEEDPMTISIGTDERPEEIYHGEIILKRLVKHTFEFDAMPYEEKVNNGVEVKTEDTEFTNETSSL